MWQDAAVYDDQIGVFQAMQAGQIGRDACGAADGAVCHPPCRFQRPASSPCCRPMKSDRGTWFPFRVRQSAGRMGR